MQRNCAGGNDTPSPLAVSDFELDPSSIGAGNECGGRQVIETTAAAAETTAAAAEETTDAAEDK